jgi:hypothetical protein
MSNTRKTFSSKTTKPAANPLAGVTFTLDKEEFRCEGRMSFLDSSDLARRVSDLPTTDLDDLRKLDPQQAATVIGSMSSTLLMALGEAEYRRFREHCRKHATPDDTLVEVLQFINSALTDGVEEESGRPTGPPSPSSSGDAGTEPRMSRIISLQTGDVTILAADDEPEQQETAARQHAKTTTKTLGTRSGGRRRTA